MPASNISNCQRAFVVSNLLRFQRKCRALTFFKEALKKVLTLTHFKGGVTFVCSLIAIFA